MPNTPVSDAAPESSNLGDAPRATLPDPALAPRTTLPDVDAETGARTTLPDVAGEDTETEPPAHELEDGGAGYAGEDDAPKRPKSSWPYFLIGGLLFMSVTGPLIFYFFVWRYRPTALMHIPQGTSVAVRFDGRQLYTYEPFRTHVLGAFDEAADKNGRADRFKTHTGVDLRKDVREVILATSNGESWVALIGGNFTTRAKTNFTVGLSKFLDEEGVSGFSVRADGVLAGPVFVAQAEDSTIVISSSGETLERCLEPGEAYQDLGLAGSGAVSFVIDRPAFENLAGTNSALKDTPFALLPSNASAARQTEKLTGYLSLKEPEFLLDITPVSTSTPEQLTKELETLQSEAKLATLLPELGGLRDVALAGRIKPRATSVMIEAEFPRAKLNELLEKVGQEIRTRFE